MTLLTTRQQTLVLLARHLAQAFRSPRREAGGITEMDEELSTVSEPEVSESKDSLGDLVWCAGRSSKLASLCTRPSWGGARPSKIVALLVGFLLRPVGRQCACAALSLVLAYALLAQNACWTACRDQFGGQLGVGDACCPFLFVSGGCGQSFGRVDPGKPPFGRMLAGFALAALVASALAGVVLGVAKVDLATPPLFRTSALPCARGYDTGWY